jgi:DNA polymerase III delta prime subunit
MRSSLLHRYKCTRIDELHTEHANVLRQMTDLDALRILILGDPGTGKSTVCRAVVNDYYGDDGRDDVLKISSLNDQGINFYRTDVRTFCQTKCSRAGKKKMVVLDDMDALVESGQQVFLSYMDSFSTLFVVTATMPSKIVPGLHSRLLTLKLSPFPTEFLLAELKRIAELEGLSIESADAANAVVTRSVGSMRAMLNYLEKIILLGKGLTQEIVDASCSSLDARILAEFSAAIELGNEYGAVDVLLAVHRDGYSVMDVLDAYFTFVKQSSHLSDARKYQIIRIISKYIVIFNQHEHAVEFIFCVHDLCTEPKK